MQLSYPARIRRQSDCYLVQFRDLGEAIASAPSREEAVIEAEDVLEAALWFRLKDGNSIPEPSEPRRGEIIIVPPIAIAAKALLAYAMQQTGTSRRALAKKLCAPVGALLNPGKPADFDQIQEAMRAIGWAPVLEAVPYDDLRARARAGDEDAEDVMTVRIARQREDEPSFPEKRRRSR